MTPNSNSAPGQEFLTSLFDLSFTSFITTKLIKLLYVLGMAFSALLALVLIRSGFSQGSGFGLLILVIVAPAIFLAMVIYLRVILELIIVCFRIAEHLAEMARQGRRSSAADARQGE